MENKNIIIQGISDDSIIIKIGNVNQEIRIDVEELQKVINAQGKSTFQIGEKIYNIGQIGHAEFKTIVQQLPHIVKKILSPATASVPLTFLGRKEELAEVRKRLKAGNTLALINGEGGIGKTSLAAKYWEHYKNDYQHTAWLFCDNGIIDTLITQLSFPLGIDLKELKTREEQVHAIRSSLSNLPKDCLLVLDNANKEEDIIEFLEDFRGIGWHILFTSRCQKVIQNEYYIEGLPPELAQRLFKVSFVTVFEFNEVINLFEQYNSDNLGTSPDGVFDSVIDTLFQKHALTIFQELPTYLNQFLEAVGYNTLVIEIFAKNLAEYSATGKGFTDFLTRLEAKGGLKLENDEDDKFCFRILTDYTFNVKKKAATSDDIIEILYDLAGLKKNEIDRLTSNALLPAENIPLPILINLFTPDDEVSYQQELNTLARKGWIYTDIKSYKVNHVVQKIVLKKNESNLWKCGEILTNNLIKELDPDNIHKENYKYSTIYSQYAENIINIFKIDILCDRVGNFYKMVGDLKKSLIFFEKYHQLKKEFYENYLKSIDSKHSLALSYQKLGHIHISLGNIDKSLIFFEKYHQLTKELHESYPNDDELKNSLAVSCQFLGYTYSSLGYLEKALYFFKDYNHLEIELHSLNPENMEFRNGLAISCQFLGITYRSLGDLDNALIAFETFNQLAKQNYNKSPNDISLKNSLAVSYQYLGETYISLGNLHSALITFEKFNYLVKELCDSHANNVEFKNFLAISYEKLGITHASLGNFDKALNFFENSNNIEKELHHLFPNNMEFKKGLAISYERLGQIHSSKGNLDKALAFFNKETELFEELYKNNPNNIDFKNSFAISLGQLGGFYINLDIQKAKMYYIQCKKLYLELTQNSPTNLNFQNILQWLENQLKELG